MYFYINSYGFFSLKIHQQSLNDKIKKIFLKFLTPGTLSCKSVTEAVDRHDHDMRKIFSHILVEVLIIFR